ncbi:FecR domain-containing protein [Halomonas sp. QX-2]|jgi:transmembrane sensor|uniref:FecR domain-containing protein n=1 Tax=Vreelandella sedimenti TaxID=2729618 RepID=A0A7Z0N8P3_9GAMM|nr:FecR domain-containing protein [Halomonas sedimenti]NYT73316.1 FecR domain-containing protein [Halomonas sedimenti]|tara:strand:+ start:91 stop:1065 length:975 start_codon:yes stop_codon:yes gene_type:complete
MSDTQAARKDTLRAAAHWYALLCSEDVTEKQKHAHAAWLAEDPAHVQAWQQVEKLRQQLQMIPGAPSLNALQIKQRQDHSRRAVLRGFALLAVGSALGSLAWQRAPVESWMASHRTARGERREYTLAGGTQLVLNTATALDVVETSTTQLIRLYAGEIFIRTRNGTGKVAAAKTLQVHTEQGTVVPLGTVFTVRKLGTSTQVTVLEDEVELIPQSAGGKTQRLVAGEQAQMSSVDVEVATVSDQADSWTRGLLVAVDWPLSRLVAELSRYRTGVLRCAPSIAGLRVSGAFPIDDTDRALQAIANALPVSVDRLTQYWVTLKSSE